MNSIIRKTRLAAEAKVLPVPAPLDARRAARAAPEASPASAASGAANGHPPEAAAASYEEYRRSIAAELAQLRQQESDSGREQGLQQGRDAAQLEWRERLELLRSLTGSLRSAQLEQLMNLADEAAEIVMIAVAKVLGDAFVSQQAALAAVREAVRRCHERGRLQVRLAPAEAQALQAAAGELLDGLRAGDLELIPDEQITTGGCIVETQAGSLDARLQVQLQRLAETLMAARAKWGHAGTEPPA